MTIDTKKLRDTARRVLNRPSTFTAVDRDELACGVIALSIEFDACKDQLAAANAEIERLRNRVLQPLTPREIEEALHEGRAEAMAATGDNAWTSLLRQRDEARDQLAAMTKARDEACGLCDVAITMHGETVGMRERIAELRKVGAK